MKTLLNLTDATSGDVIVADRFRIVRSIGEGAAGEVFEAVQLSVDRRVALKMLHAPNTAISDYRARFSREAKAVARLNHPNCITLHDFGYSEELDCLYMVTEYVEGRELYSLLGTRIPLRTTLRYAVQIAEALAHAHGCGILHRDLKPENVLITDDGRVKVLDFGLARILDEIGSDDGRRLTAQGAIYGTPQYMSPEQCEGDLTLDERADIYSLGVMLYEMFAGQLPFDSKDIMKVLVKHIREPAPPMPDDLPEELRAVVMSCLEKNREDRPSTAAEVAATLQTLLVGHALDAGEIPADISQEISRRLVRQNFPDDTPDPFRITDHLVHLPPEDAGADEPASPAADEDDDADDADFVAPGRGRALAVVIAAAVLSALFFGLTQLDDAPEPTADAEPAGEAVITPVEEPTEASPEVPEPAAEPAPPAETAEPEAPAEVEDPPTSAPERATRPEPKSKKAAAAKKPTKPAEPEEKAAEPSTKDTADHPEKPDKLPTLEFGY